jgi:hypothetical protein
MLLAGECLQQIAWVAVVVIDVACELMAYKTQLLAYLSHRKPIVVFCNGMKMSDSDDINEEFSIFYVKTL